MFTGDSMYIQSSLNIRQVQHLQDVNPELANHYKHIPQFKYQSLPNS